MYLTDYKNFLRLFQSLIYNCTYKTAVGYLDNTTKVIFCNIVHVMRLIADFMVCGCEVVYQEHARFPVILCGIDKAYVFFLHLLTLPS